MKINVILIVVFLVLFCQCSENNDKKKSSLRGKVKKIEVSIFNGVYKFGDIEKDTLKLKEISKYDSKGNMIEKNTYDFDGSVWLEKTFKNNDKGIVIEGVEYLLGTLHKTIAYKYDDNCNMIEYNEYYDNGSSWLKETYKNDDKGTAIEKMKYYEDSFHSKSVYKHNDRGDVIEEVLYNSDGNMFIIMAYKHDDRGNIVEEIWYDSDGKVSLEQKYGYNEFDKHDNWISRSVNHDGIVYHIEERKIEYYP